MLNNKHVLAIDFILVVGSLLVIAGLVGYTQPQVIAPLDDTVTTNTAVLFEFEKANVIFIDDNLEFTSPTEIRVEDNLVINLKPGVYYWKVGGALISDIRTLTIQSEVDLKIKESKKEEDKYEIVNSGNTKLNVDIYRFGEVTDSVILDVDESEDVSGTKFVGNEVREDDS